ncbi:hypothetical protein ACGFX2_26655 [Streptomyces goshikiensis]|uniref:hypothetical protein n=1 Tax=Streptomyces goshikiensis TaxID=1942 RepID=UPI00371FE08C
MPSNSQSWKPLRPPSLESRRPTPSGAALSLASYAAIHATLAVPPWAAPPMDPRLSWAVSVAGGLATFLAGCVRLSRTSD